MLKVLCHDIRLIFSNYMSHKTNFTLMFEIRHRLFNQQRRFKVHHAANCDMEGKFCHLTIIFKVECLSAESSRMRV